MFATCEIYVHLKTNAKAELSSSTGARSCKLNANPLEAQANDCVCMFFVNLSQWWLRLAFFLPIVQTFTKPYGMNDTAVASMHGAFDVGKPSYKAYQTTSALCLDSSFMLSENVLCIWNNRHGVPAAVAILLANSLPVISNENLASEKVHEHIVHKL